jgi:hypothetical protein
VAFLAAPHALCVKVFYRYAVGSCLELDLKGVAFGAQARGLSDTALAAEAWISALPKEPTEPVGRASGDAHRRLTTRHIPRSNAANTALREIRGAQCRLSPSRTSPQTGAT